MTRYHRYDEPGAWHHVMNRGLARRTIFESDRDVRYFLACLARRVRAGDLEVHSFVVLSTHFHLLVRSKNGQLSDTLRRVQNDYARWFNRGRRRDGPLFRGRFRSRRVESFEYQVELVRYIDANPVEARLAPRPIEYVHGSAIHYARPKGPPWLERRWVEERVCLQFGLAIYDPARYAERFEGTTERITENLLSRRLARTRNRADPLDEFVRGGPSAVRSWMERKARTGDGTEVGIPVCDPVHVDRVIEDVRRRSDVLITGATRPECDAWSVLRVGLLRDLCAASLREVGQRVGFSIATATRKQALHRRWIRDEPRYAAAAAEIASQAIGPGRGGHPGGAVVPSQG